MSNFSNSKLRSDNPFLYNSKLLLLLSVISSAILFLPALAKSDPVSSAPPSNCPPLEPRNTPAPGSVRTADNIFQSSLTPPSLWWADEQFGGKLLDNWCAYPAERRVDLVVNRQIWTLLTYLERYEFTHHLGMTVSDFNYNMRVFDRRKTLLATYNCDFGTTPVRCDLWLDNTSRRGFPGRFENR